MALLRDLMTPALSKLSLYIRFFRLNAEAERTKSNSRSRLQGGRSSAEKTQEQEVHVENDGTSVYIANLSKRVKDEDLDDEFRRFGKIRKCSVVIDPISRYVTLQASIISSQWQLSCFKPKSQFQAFQVCLTIPT